MYVGMYIVSTTKKFKRISIRKAISCIKGSNIWRNVDGNTTDIVVHLLHDRKRTRRVSSLLRMHVQCMYT